MALRNIKSNACGCASVLSDRADSNPELNIRLKIRMAHRYVMTGREL
jgi:hypothetical protein